MSERRILSQSNEKGHECSFCKSVFFRLHECTYSDNGIIRHEIILKCANCNETIRAGLLER